jgi:transcriptional regulator with XRE-family HTH domain
MANPTLHELLRQVRQASHWPEIADFASRVGLSFGGYRKYESGERLPSQEALDVIIRHGLVDADMAHQLTEAWNQAKADQVGVVARVGEKKSVDHAKLADHIRNEVVYVLKQDGIYPQERTKQVLLNRILILLRSKLEE